MAPPPKQSAVATAATTVRGMVAGAVTAVTGAMSRRGAEPDAIELLEREHRRFEQLLKEGEETTEQARQTRRGLLETLTRELNAHELMEERVLYPALQSHPQAHDIVLEGFEEHHVADLIVKELHEVATDDEQWGAKFKVLKENIEHHIEEEEGEMFRVARGVFSRDELRDLAARMLAIRPAT
ncbi:MAG TPA: hemerythrin domain-containing protein [Vicinamibacterales bacterium]|nr:hemerythrin domain-containing protein [Vicinamibacterales bacterium]